MLAAATFAAPVAPNADPFPFPQDCSHLNASSKAPTWFTDCESAAGGCFVINVPDETKYNTGNTTFGASSAGGTKWCIDHLQGIIFNKVIDPVGAMYYEIDDIQQPAPAPQCRFLVGAEDDGKGGVDYHARTYNNAGLICTLTNTSLKAGVTSYHLDVAVAPPPVLVGAKKMGLLKHSKTNGHYGDPYTGCAADEKSFTIQGLTGEVCSPSCTSAACPTDVPTGVTASPQCALQDQSGNKYCVLLCTPSVEDDQCGENASCKPIQGQGVCTYDS